MGVSSISYSSSDFNGTSGGDSSSSTKVSPTTEVGDPSTFVHSIGSSAQGAKSVVGVL
jgi:hypothetical protein